MGYRPPIVLCVHIFILFHITEAVFTNEYKDNNWFIKGNEPIQVTFQKEEQRLILTANMQKNGMGNQLKDHVYRTPDQGQAVNEKMQHIVRFFKGHSDEILQSIGEDTIRGRFFNMGRGVSTIITQTEPLWLTLLAEEREGDSGGKIVLTFEVLYGEWDSRKPIYISHFGPFSAIWTEIMIFHTRKAHEIRNMLEGSREFVREANAGVAEARVLKDMDDPKAQKRRDDKLEEASKRVESAETYLNRFATYVTYEEDTHDLPYTWWQVVQEMNKLPSTIEGLCKIANSKIQEVKNAKSVTVWGTSAQGRRRKRETEDDTDERDNNMVSLGAQLELLDSDPDSEFLITKVEFKEVHSGVEETHTWDVERNVLMVDPNIEGSVLTAEVQVDGKRKPADIETAVKNKVLSIVLSPRRE